MAVSVDVKGIRSALRDGDGLWLVISSATRGALADVLTRWVAEAGARAEERPDLQLVQVLGPLQLPDGVCLLRLVGYAEHKHTVAAVTELAAALEVAGIDARIDRQQETLSPPRMAAPSHLGPVAIRRARTAVSVTLPWRPDALRRREQRRAAGVPTLLRGWHRSDLQEEAWAAVVDTALAWCQQMSNGATGQRYVAHGMSSLQVPAAQWEATARLALGSPSLEVWASGMDWPGEVREVAFEHPPGRVLFQLLEDGFSPPESTVARARELIERLQPHITSAFVLQTAATVPALMTRHLLKRQTTREASPTQPAEPLSAKHLDHLALMDDRRLIDAFGLMYLGPGFRGLAVDSQLYRVEPLGPGRLLTATDLDTWFRADGQPPRRHVLDAARADIADAIATYDEYRRSRQSQEADVPRILD
ncbi:hypothetical protein GCM10027451_37920 [Geodermatophilus aquaeductus]|uniref:Uncharacterized protein n=1 Tax=Geodermatophilus aquaeductus TaxID=1564161 RepID=A0A521FJ09_9ACTN|nr:hypothetical protein [Geodermatophilus aquaeductus]SMO95570.1 hypothetical protein SAMN06273567_1099 [Geodermatophilus aquaeductus]